MSKPNPTPTPDRPEDRLARVMETFFRSVTGSHDRELAETAFRLEAPVLKLVRGSARSGQPRRQPARRLARSIAS